MDEETNSVWIEGYRCYINECWRKSHKAYPNFSLNTPGLLNKSVGSLRWAFEVSFLPHHQGPSPSTADLIIMDASKPEEWDWSGENY